MKKHINSISGALTSIATAFSEIPCVGDYYQVKMPGKLSEKK